MIKRTEILKRKYNPDRIWVINPLQGRQDNVGYSAPFPIWWIFLKLRGVGYIIGEDQMQGDFIKDKLKADFPGRIISLESVNLENADVNLDITTTKLPKQVNFIFCMAVLEHTIDPGSAIRNMSRALTKEGYLFISVPGQKFKQHRRPIDCYRFLEDAMFAFAQIGNLKLVDYTKTVEWCAVYQKEA